MLDIYCDESCHLENDNSNVMVLGAVYVPTNERITVYNDIYKIRERFSMPKFREIKWTKVSFGELDFYKELVRYFFNNELLKFRGVIIPDKSKLKHELFNQTHDDFYYKMYYIMLKKLINREHSLNIYLDYKDTNGSQKIKGLNQFLNYKLQSEQGKNINKIQLIRSHENQIMQLTDLIIGALSYHHRGLESSSAKIDLINTIEEFAVINTSSNYSNEKFNILIWSPK